jgi:hypothetical protein
MTQLPNKFLLAQDTCTTEAGPEKSVPPERTALPSPCSGEPVGAARPEAPAGSFLATLLRALSAWPA